MWTKRGKARLILISSTNTNCENMAYRSFRSEKCSARGVRKVTTGITGLWQPGVHSDVACWSFDVGSSYHWDAEVPKCRILASLTGVFEATEHNVEEVRHVLGQRHGDLHLECTWHKCRPKIAYALGQWLVCLHSYWPCFRSARQE